MWQKLTHDEANILHKSSSGSGSLWNAAGTFEEVCVTKWAKERLEDLLTHVQSKDPHVTIVRMKECNGDANLWIVRGKKKCGFDFEITLEWTANVAGEDINGTIKILEASPDTLDELQLEVKAIENKQKQGKHLHPEAAKQARTLATKLEEALNAFYIELQNK